MWAEITPDVVDIRAFYASRLGAVAARLIRERIRALWPSVAGETVLGIGYATPYLGALSGNAARTLAFMPAAQGVAPWPPRGRNAAALVLDGALPLPDAAIDRILAVHSLEMAENARDLLRELWRVLAPGGRLLAVVPNRRGIWTRAERTPFGYGRPFTRGQLGSLLRERMFAPLGWGEALFMPPLSRLQLYRSGAAWERVGGMLWPAFSGVILVEAKKELYQGVPARRAARRAPALRPALLPPASACAGPARPLNSARSRAAAPSR